MCSPDVPELLARAGVSVAQWCVLCSCGYGPKPDWGVVADAVAECRHCRYGSISEEEAEAAIRSCVSAGWLRTIDEVSLEEMEESVAQKRLIGPVYCFPSVGDVDFTPGGVAFFQKLSYEVFGTRPGADEDFYVQSDGGTVAYCPTFEAAQRVAEEYRQFPNFAFVSQPAPIGRWCVYWWLEFASGYRLIVRKKATPD